LVGGLELHAPNRRHLAETFAPGGRQGEPAGARVDEGVEADLARGIQRVANHDRDEDSIHGGQCSRHAIGGQELRVVM